MNIEQVREWVAAGQVQAAETALLEAVEAHHSLAEVAVALEELVKAGHLDLAETTALMFLEHQDRSLPAVERLAQVQVLASAVPDSSELRSRALALYREAYASNPHLDDLLQFSGLANKQSPRRAFRTLDTCLRALPGTYLASRYDGKALRVEKFDPLMHDFEVSDSAGRRERHEPRTLADEYDPAEADDFRVACQFHPHELAELARSEPAAVLVGVCRTRGGQISAPDLKELLCPRVVPAQQWSSWWNSARTAAKRCPQLSLEGRPIVVKYHPDGLSLEEELAEQAAAAKMPLERLALLAQYVREARVRKLEPKEAFVGPQMAPLAQQVREFLDRRPADSLAAALAIEAAQAMGLAKPAGQWPAPKAVLQSVKDPAAATARLAGTPLWGAALEVLATLPNAVALLSSLWRRVGRGELDDLAGWLVRLGGTDVVEHAVSAAMAEPSTHLETLLWLWRGPSVAPANAPRKAELLGKLLGEVQRVERERDSEPAAYKSTCGAIRETLRSGDFGAFRQAVSEMNEQVASTVKRLIERTDGLAEAVRDQCLSILRETFFGLFVTRGPKVEPWFDEDVIYTTSAAMDRRREELRVLNDVTLPANSRAIGEAAGHGDLRENSEWKFAREERANLLARASKMQDEMLKAQVISAHDVPGDRVVIGSKVTLRRLSDNQTVQLSILGPWDADMEKRVYNYQTPLARSLLGSNLGDEVALRLDGQEDQYAIEKLEPAV